MIKINISEILGERKMSRIDLARISGVSSATITELYYERVKMINIETLNKICNALKCPLSDVIEHIPDKEVE